MKIEDIERAAKEEAEKKECLVYYGGTAISQEDLEEAFINGAKWRINSVWHDASETPKKQGYILVQIIDDYNCTIFVAWNINDNPATYWNKIINRNNIVKWAYIEDLLPTQ